MTRDEKIDDLLQQVYQHKYNVQLLNYAASKWGESVSELQE